VSNSACSSACGSQLKDLSIPSIRHELEVLLMKQRVSSIIEVNLQRDKSHFGMATSVFFAAVLAILLFAAIAYGDCFGFEYIRCWEGI